MMASSIVAAALRIDRGAMAPAFLINLSRPLRRAARILTLLGGTGLTLLGGGLVLAGEQDPPRPSRASLRELQLLVFDCSRENRDGPCGQARAMADPLLDHPRLSGSCKDTLWQIRERAVVAAENSFARRDQLNRTANDMLRFCQRGDQGAPR